MLNAQAHSLREELTSLHENLAEVRRDTSGLHAAELLEANQQLVIAALHADRIAEKAVNSLSELTRSCQRDSLTNTPNRELMLDRLSTAITMARRHGTHLAVLFLDMDHFKRINDTLGHAAGDEVLKLVAVRTESVIRDSDTVSRHSGDEFLILLAEVAHSWDAAHIAEKILTALAEPSRVGAHVLSLSASIGIAIYPEDGKDAATLIGRADAAMYRSKKNGRCGFAFHGEEPHGDESASVNDDALRSLDFSRTPTERNELLHVGHEPAMNDLREANEKLVIATLSAHEMQAQATEAHHRQITFLGMVAHELRNPLTPIRTAAEMLNMDDIRIDDGKLVRLQIIIKRQVEHMSRLVEDLLDGSRVNNGKFRLHREPMELTDALNVAIETTRPAMEARQQHLTLQLPSQALVVDGDAVRLAQVFSNLLDNASKYTPEGGEIRLSANASTDVAIVTVADNGVGITATALPDIFGLFVQETHALRPGNDGLGIGLAVVRDLVEAHGGTVIGSSDGRDLGSEFVVTLPLASAI